jgi:restriction system protein
MFRSFVRYIVLTLVIGLTGMTIGIFGLSMQPAPSKPTALAMVGMLIFFFSPIIAGLWYWFKRRRKLATHDELAAEEARSNFLRHRFLERQRLIDSIDRYRSPLTRNLERAVRKNDYGLLISDTTKDALQEFFASIYLDVEAISFDDAAEIVFEQLEFRRNELLESRFDPTNLPFDGGAFEKWVADALTGFGWEAKLTKGGGDQGIDVIAERHGRKLGLQCKLYSSPIGNKAVQEAHAGKVYYGLDAAAVLTNTSFTASAKELASVTGIWLLSHHDIPALHQKVFGSS